jgi:hypothetical protein
LTVGPSTRPLAELIALLATHSVSRPIDVHPVPLVTTRTYHAGNHDEPRNRQHDPLPDR